MHASMIDGDGFRANVGIVMVSPGHEVFWARRLGGRGWQFPQGGMLEGETPEQAMYRELDEEIGLAPGQVRLLGRTRDWLRYRLPPRYRRAQEAPLCVGQKQLWFLLRLEAAETAIRLDGGACPEFDTWRWVDWRWPPQEVVFFKRRVYEQALDELEALLHQG